MDFFQEEILSKLNTRQSVKKKDHQFTNEHQSPTQKLIPLDEQSDYYEAAAKSFKIVSAPEKGRYAVATSDLVPGTLLLQVADISMEMMITLMMTAEDCNGDV